MPLFDIPNRLGKADTVSLAKKSKTSKKTQTTIKSGNSLMDKISSIVALCESKLGKYKDKYDVIRNEEELHNYIDRCIENGIISIDTETTGLDPISDNIAGLCLYTPGQKAVYVPINHISYITGNRVENQLTEKQCQVEMQRIADNKIDVIMFNADFDIRVIRNQLNVYLQCTFDCYLAARCLNENEPSNQLKVLHNKYCLDGQGDAWTFGDLFKGIIFTNIPINSAYLYAARDAEITYELYMYQKPFLTETDEKCVSHNLQGVANVFNNIEMPCVSVVADMEDNGVTFDFEKQKELSLKYNKLLDEKKKECYDLISEYDDKIEEYKIRNINHKLDSPINIGSPTQLAILLYDILNVEPPDSKSPRGTGEAILAKIDLPICKAILEYRGLDKLIGTYIDKLPECVNPKDGKIHCKFNQYGADTGRFSSNDPKQIISNWGRKIRLIQGRAFA